MPLLPDPVNVEEFWPPDWLPVDEVDSQTPPEALAFDPEAIPLLLLFELSEKFDFRLSPSIKFSSPSETDKLSWNDAVDKQHSWQIARK